LFKGPPSLAQIERVVKRDETMPLLARAAVKPEGGADIELGCVHLQEGCKAEQ
jgi:hypothetical protein